MHPHVSMDKLITTLLLQNQEAGGGFGGRKERARGDEQEHWWWGFLQPSALLHSLRGPHIFLVLLTSGQPFLIPVLDLPLLTANTTKQTSSDWKSPYCPSAGHLLNKL